MSDCIFSRKTGTYTKKGDHHKMRVIEPGHQYELFQLDTDENTKSQILTFVNREEGLEHAGTQIQEVLRVQIDMLNCLIDRTNHCDEARPWDGNAKIIQRMTESQRQMRLILLLFENRAHEQKIGKGLYKPEHEPVGTDGHFSVRQRSQ